MRSADRFEAGLTWSLPWLVCLIAAWAAALLTAPRPALRDPQRLWSVGKPAGTVPIYDRGRQPPAETGRLSQLCLIDLARSDADWLALVTGGGVRRSDVAFRVELLQPAQKQPVEHGELDIDLDLSFPEPQEGGERQLLLTVHPYRVLPPAGWDSYVYRIVNGRPVPVLVLRDQPSALGLGRDDEGRLVLGHEALTRRNQVWTWTGGCYELKPLNTPWPRLAELVAGPLSVAPWWTWLVVALPLASLALAAVEAAGRLRAASRLGRTDDLELRALLLGLLLVVAAMAAADRLWLDPGLDRVTGLVTPVLLGLAVHLPLRWAAGAAERRIDPLAAKG